MNKFLKEIHEQPRAIRDTLTFFRSGEGIELLDEAKSHIINGGYDHIIFTGMGSSYFVASAITTLFNRAGVASHFINASELMHYNMKLLDKKTLLVCLSQSGESYEIRALLDQIGDSVYCIGISNECESTLATKADIALCSRAGREEMTSTKTYVCTTLIGYILGWHLSGDWDHAKEEQVDTMVRGFCSDLASPASMLYKMEEFFGDMTSVYLIARGPGFSTACQSGLMFKEANAIAATGILGGEFRHGPMEMVRPGFKAFVFAAAGKTYDQNIKMAKDIAKYGGKVILITNAPQELDSDQIMEIHVDQPDEYLFSIQSIIPIQLYIDAYAKNRGFEAGSFSHGAKVTMVE